MTDPLDYFLVEAEPSSRNGTLGQGPSTVVDIFDNLRNLPPVDLVKEYGLKPGDLTLYAKPLGKDICLVNVDNRVWSPSSGLDKQDDLGWGRLNQYLYGQSPTSILKAIAVLTLC